jgi:hypothetical protein
MSISTVLNSAKTNTLTFLTTLWGKIKNYVIAALGLITLVLLGYERYQEGKVKSLQSQVD